MSPPSWQHFRPPFPESRFWPLQGAETGIYLVLATGLGTLCTWQIRRRRA